MKIKLSSILLFVFASAVMGSGIGYSKLYLFHVALVVFFIAFVIRNFMDGGQNTLSKPKNNYILFLYFMFAWYAVSIIWSINPLYTLRYLFYLFLGIALVFLVSAYANTRAKYISVFNVLGFFFIVAIVVALLEAFTAFRLPTSPYSSYASLFGRGATDFTEIDTFVQVLIRSAPTSFWGNPNNLSVVMSIIAPFFMFHSKTIIKVLGLLSIVLIITMAGSRGAFIGLVFGFSVFLFVRGVFYVLPILIMVIFGFGFFAGNIESLKNSENKRIAELAWTGDQLYSYLFEDVQSMNSIGARQQLIKNGLNALWDTAGLGVGGGGSQAVQERFGGVAGKLASMHNFWIEILVDAGVLFFIAFMIWYLKLSYSLYRIYKKTTDTFYQYQAGALLVSMMTFIITSVSASSVIYLLPMWLMFGMAIALYNLYKREPA